MQYEKPEIKVMKLPEAEVFTLTGTSEGTGDGREPEPKNATNSWL